MSFDRFTHEREWLAKGCQRIAGVDEVGRGPLAGPVVAAAAVFSLAAIQAGLPEPLSEVNDSKKLSAKKRDTLYEALNEFGGVEFALAVIEPAEIDRINILQATHKAMKEALAALGQAPENVQSIPTKMTDWFMEIGAICRKVDVFLTKKEQQDSPMLQAGLMGEGMELHHEVAELHQKLQTELAKIDDSLKALNSDWERLDGVIDGRATRLPLAKLDALGQRLSFWVKWSAQLGERSSRLMF